MSNAVSVTELTRAIRSTLEEGFDAVLVEGELSGVKHHSSGHLYFTLKDEGATISCAMWRPQVQRLPAMPRDGQRVVVAGRISVYEPRGAYQLIANLLKPAGLGDLNQRLEELKRKLSAEGLFEASRKKDIPPYPTRVALITSRTGAVLHDIWHVLSRRAPHLELLVVPTSVQGAEAVPGIVRALEQLRALEGTPDAPDVVILARGGGSLEDLWAFNEEAVVRAVADCPFPTISAVGHETDTTLCDFAADLRAPTPSAAAELVSEERLTLLSQLAEIEERSRAGLLRLVTRRRERLEMLAKRPCLLRPDEPLRRAGQSLDLLTDRLERSIRQFSKAKNSDLAVVAGKLEALSPLRVLSRGFAAISSESGAVVMKSTDLSPGDRIKISFADAPRMARVE
ncbi:MAG: exodeoxyribonuclease VII large subunit [Fibrobacteres bacterium]|jgi:exodeoxyribonuclease VII large subunit|nr:exodeoxyribonuclease VII large subunit [Fibrobacterota bacterium]